MSYTHDGKKPVRMSSHPIDPDSSDWVFFIYEDYLRTGESISTHEALIDGGTLVFDSTYIGILPDENGNEHNEVYGVKVKPDADVDIVTVTHRVSTSVVGDVDIGRDNIDRTVIIPVRNL